MFHGIKTEALKDVLARNIAEHIDGDDFHDVEYDDWCPIDMRWQYEAHWGIDKGEPFAYAVQHDLMQIAQECQEFRDRVKATKNAQKNKDKAQHGLMTCGSYSFVIPHIVFKELEAQGFPMAEMKSTGRYTNEIKYLFDTKYSAFKLTDRWLSKQFGAKQKTSSGLII